MRRNGPPTSLANTGPVESAGHRSRCSATSLTNQPGIGTVQPPGARLRERLERGVAADLDHRPQHRQRPTVEVKAAPSGRRSPDHSSGCRARRACGLAPGPAARQRRRRAATTRRTPRERAWPSPGRQVSGMGTTAHRPADGWRRQEVPSRRPPEGLSGRPQGASLATTGQLSSTVAPWGRPDRATPGRRDGTELARMCRVSLALTSE